MIPKVIYYVWLGNNKLPFKVRENIKSWKINNPDYKIIQVNENNFCIDKYPFIKDAYKDKNYAFASDMIRLIVVYEHGGFYFDTDVKIIKSLEPLRKKKSVWGLENADSINSGLIIGAQKGDHNIGELIQIYSSKQYSRKNLKTLITVPIITKYFANHGFHFENKLQILKDGTTIFPTEYFAPLHWWGGGKITKDTISVHQYAASWVNGNNVNIKTKLRNNFILKAPSLFYFLRRVILDRS